MTKERTQSERKEKTRLVAQSQGKTVSRNRGLVSKAGRKQRKHTQKASCWITMRWSLAVWQEPGTWELREEHDGSELRRELWGSRLFCEEAPR